MTVMHDRDDNEREERDEYGHPAADNNGSPSLNARSGVPAHRHRRGRLPRGVVRMGRDAAGAGRGHHHRVRHRVLHCRGKIAVSRWCRECALALGGQVRIGRRRTLRALVVVVWVRVRRDRRGRHRRTGARAVWWWGVRPGRGRRGHVRLGS